MNPSKTSAWKQAGIYGLEFGLAAAGTSIAAAGAFGVMAAVAVPVPYPPDVPMAAGLLTFLLTSPFLSATGAYFGGKLVGQKGSFWYTLVGSLAGEAVGTAGAYGYSHFWASRHNYWGRTQNVVVSGCMLIPPALGAVIAYNVWRRDDAK